MKLNASKTKTMIVSRSHTMHPQLPPLTIGRTVLKESDDLVILGVTFDSKIIFEKHLCFVSSAASQRLGILRKSWRVFHDRSLLGRYFRILSCQFWSTVLQMWCSAADKIRCNPTLLLYRAVSGARFLTGGVFECVLIVDLLQFCVCCIRSGVTRCIRLMMCYHDRMCQCWLHAVPW